MVYYYYYHWIFYSVIVAMQLLLIAHKRRLLLREAEDSLSPSRFVARSPQAELKRKYLENYHISFIIIYTDYLICFYL